MALASLKWQKHIQCIVVIANQKLNSSYTTFSHNLIRQQVLSGEQLI